MEELRVVAQRVSQAGTSPGAGLGLASSTGTEPEPAEEAGGVGGLGEGWSLARFPSPCLVFRGTIKRFGCQGIMTNQIATATLGKQHEEGKFWASRGSGSGSC